MKTNALRWMLIAGLTAVVSLTLWARAALTARLQHEVELSRAEQREVAQLRIEHQQLAAVQPSAAEMDRLRADRDAMEQMETAAMTMRARLASPPVDPPVSGRPSPATPPPPLSADQWKNAGCASPAATLETALWAASGGDLDTLARMLSLDARSHEKAQALFDALPPSAQNKYGSAERLVALLAMQDVPTESLQIIGEMRMSRDQVAMRVRLQDADGATKFTTLRLQHAGDEWQLIVPEKAVDRYAAILKGTEVQQLGRPN
jgi:hypothetical protein